MYTLKFNDDVCILGLESRGNEVPFRFLVKQLLVEKNRVIFTGKAKMYIAMGFLI